MGNGRTGPQVNLSAIVGVLVVALLALLGAETLVIVLDPHDDRDPRGWIAAFILAITVGGALALVA
ncbi:hypothetical protein [Actinomycetospora chiangmaiensis]|uniref:hypothetical protein n=1 Tax=Actinomycetospora chiangmaiensis TaxID=402650 RepID=UPI0003713A82|nr:hypothetical protein [Actinomycetospora chiangmaiensis]